MRNMTKTLLSPVKGNENDKFSKYAEPNKKTKVSQLFYDTNLDEDLADQEEKDGSVIILLDKFYEKK